MRLVVLQEFDVENLVLQFITLIMNATSQFMT